MGVYGLRRRVWGVQGLGGRVFGVRIQRVAFWSLGFAVWRVRLKDLGFRAHVVGSEFRT